MQNKAMTNTAVLVWRLQEHPGSPDLLSLPWYPSLSQEKGRWSILSAQTLEDSTDFQLLSTVKLRVLPDRDRLSRL